MERLHLYEVLNALIKKMRVNCSLIVHNLG